MNALRITVLLLFGCVFEATATGAISDSVPASSPADLETAREAGRLNSRYLKPTATSLEDTGAVVVSDVAHFHKVIQPILNRSCLGCHGPDKTEGGLRIDQLDPDFLNGGNVDRWREVYSALSNSEMPPDDEPDFALADAERGGIVDWLGSEMNKASIQQRNAAVHSSFRRMTRYEFNNALKDLFGLPFDFAARLPPETESDDGFRNSSELLQMSAMQFETTHEICLEALRRATVQSERIQPVIYSISMQEVLNRASSAGRTEDIGDGDAIQFWKQRGQLLFNRETGEAISFNDGAALPVEGEVAGKPAKASPAVLVMAGGREVKWNLDRFLPDEGIMRVSIRAGRSNMNTDQYASLRLIFSAHTSNDASFSQVISEHDVAVTASADDPQYVYFDIPLQDIQRNPFRKLETTFPRRDEFLTIRNVSSERGNEEPLFVLIDHIEITAPFYEQWPPKSHTDIFFESENKQDEQIYGREVLSKFLRRAWRRPVTGHEVEQFMQLFSQYRSEFSTFEDAMVEVLAAALASPDFLYITQRIPGGPGASGPGASQSDVSGAISDLELASRLSFFLWSSIPDEILIEIAERGQLHDPEVLKGQVDRMLKDPRSRRFSENFVQQWLGLDGLENVAHVPDSSLKQAMREEPVAYFEEILQSGNSVLDLLHSDYVVVNETLAGHYGIPHVFGPHFRRVAVEPQVNRGGILTTAGMLTMNSDGHDSHPLKRGVWMLERILQDPPPPPPANVPQVDLTDPEILKMTLKERIADHRNKPACQSCHSRIDPWGIAFENYDALGIHRTTIKDHPVDATALLFNKQELAGMDGLKRYLLINRQDQFVRAMVEKLTMYALGRPLSFSDRADIDDLTREFRRQDDRLRDLIHLIVNSRIFMSR
ncbi:MAG: DUF1592 domain-containing protein [Planctomyces sp.]|nr:DUF1592 domain-containing protein [Planctomyces sp.]